MARIRTIKPSMFSSLTVAAWPFEVRWLFAGLFTYLDDYGYGIDEPRLVKAEVFPLDDKITANKVDGFLSRISESGPLCRYEVDGRNYMHVVTWKEHQRVSHPTDSSVPWCPAHTFERNES